MSVTALCTDQGTVHWLFRVFKIRILKCLMVLSFDLRNLYVGDRRGKNITTIIAGCVHFRRTNLVLPTNLYFSWAGTKLYCAVSQHSMRHCTVV